MNLYIDPLTVDNIKTDTFQFGLAMLLSQLFAGHSLFSNNCANTKTIFLTLIGFAIYQFAIAKIGLDKIKSSFVRITLDDTLKFATALFFAKLVGDPKNLLSKEFGLGTAHLLISFAFYNLILSKYLVSLMVKPGMQLNHIMALNDTFKFTFVLIFSGILNHLTDIGKVNFEFIRLTLGYVTGIVGFDLFLA